MNSTVLKPNLPSFHVYRTLSLQEKDYCWGGKTAAKKIQICLNLGFEWMHDHGNYEVRGHQNKPRKTIQLLK